MAEYIEREAVVMELNKTYDNMNAMGAQFYSGFMNAVHRIKDFPAADVAPVRHARWVKIYENGEPKVEQHQVGVFCSKCMNMPKDRFTESDYCPNCGAKMDGGAN